MKICICSFTGFNSLHGGNLRVFHLAKELINRGAFVEFITPGREDAESCEKRFGVKADDVGIDIERFERSRLRKYPVFTIKAGRKMQGYDIVFGQSLPSALAVKLGRTGGKKVVDFVDLWSEYWVYANPSLKGRIIYKTIKNAEKYSLRGMDLIFTISREIKSMLKERGGDPEKIKIVRDGVDTKMFRPFKVGKDFFAKYGLKDGEYIIYQGGIAAHDGVQFLVEAAPLVLKENPDVKFLIVGTGSYFNKIKERVDKLRLGESFIFTGWVPYEDMPLFMNLARINAVPLPNAPATRGVITLKILEAMACGKPTIIGDLPGVREYVEHGKTAYLTRSEDKKQLAEGINELLNDKVLYNRIKRQGLDMIGRHDWRKVSRDMVSIIMEL